MDWHLTWQDPVALALVLVGLWLALRLRRERPDPCAGCAKKGVPRAATDTPPPAPEA